jgi:excisionase family DNA binding protein
MIESRPLRRGTCALDDLLTTRQLQELLKVDRITIYRMLNDGRLHGFKVGGQWRFSRQEIEAWLHEKQGQPPGTDASPPSSDKHPPSAEALPLSCVQAIQEICAEALDIGFVTLDLEGRTLTKVSNSCPFCDLILSTAKGRNRCAADWKQVNSGQMHTCHAGLLCTSALVKINHQPVAITAGCQFAVRTTPSDEAPGQHRIPLLSVELGVNQEVLEAAGNTLRLMQEEHMDRVVSLVERAAATFAEIGQERLALLSRLQHIAEMSKIT